MTYQSELWLRQCLECLDQAAPGFEVEVIVVDNASTDQTAQRARDLGAVTIANPVNVGFGRAANQGLKLASGEFVVFLNPDTTPAPSSLSTLIEALNRDASLALVSAALLNPDGTPNSAIELYFKTFLPATLRLLGIGRFGAHRERLDRCPLEGVLEIQWLAGACLAMRTSDARLLGGFDERFFMYQEDMDLCLRAKRLGRVAVVGNAHVIHHGGASARTTGKVVKADQIARSSVTFVAIHSGPYLSLVYAILAAIRYWPNALLDVFRPTKRAHYWTSITGYLRQGVSEITTRRAREPWTPTLRAQAGDGITALVLTHNAGESLRRCLTAINAQVLRPSRVIILKSGTQPINSFLPRCEDGRTEPDVRSLTANVGPAGGHAAGLRLFLSGTSQYAWVLDDDMYPDPACLDSLVRDASTKPPAVLLPQIQEPDGSLQRYPAWCGVLLPRSVVARLGVPNAELFWWTEDTEYLQHRPAKAGVQIRSVPSAIVQHGHVRLVHGVVPWKIYYETRNSIYYRVWIQKLAHPAKLFRALAVLLLHVMHEPGRAKHLSLYGHGVLDGIFKRLGRRLQVD